VSLIAVRRGFGMVELFWRDRKSGDLGTIVTVQHPRPATIAAAHIANPIAGSNGGFLRHQAGEISDGFHRGFFSGDPISMVHIGPPDLAVKFVEIVVMGGDGGVVWNATGRCDHESER
jgi:hypothetical protein